MRVVPFDNQKFAAAGKSPAWKPGDGAVAFGNPKFALVLHVTVTNDEGSPLYDQILRAEAGGGMAVVVNEQGEIGLQHHAFRPQTNNQEAWKEAWPNVEPLVAELGRTSWELARGFAGLKKKQEGAESGADTAVRETEEETQSVVVSAESLGQVCDNTAMSPHMTAIMLVRVDQTRKPSVVADPHEKFLSPLTFFNRKQVVKMMGSGEIYCGYTLGGIARWLTLGETEKK